VRQGTIYWACISCGVKEICVEGTGIHLQVGSDVGRAGNNWKGLISNASA
jgi:hypothetical protein